jgi:hypothetical protein
MAALLADGHWQALVAKVGSIERVCYERRPERVFALVQ